MRGRWLLAIVAVAVALLVGRAVAAAYADGLWYAALGAEALWRDKLWYVLLARGGSAIVAAAFVFVNLYAVRRSVVALVLPRRLANVEIGEEVPGRHLVIAAAVIAIVFGWLLALPADSWQQLALAQHGVQFRETDPYFQDDLDFFVYRLPLEASMFAATFVAVLTTLVLVLFFYALTPSLRWERGRLRLSQYARRHVVVLLALMLLVLAWSFRLDEYGLLLAGSGTDGVMTFIDHHAILPSGDYLALFAIGAAFMLLLLGWMGQLRAAAIALGALFVAGVGVRQVWPVVVRWSASDTELLRREQPYELTRAKYTRRGFALDRIAVADTGFRFATPAAASAGVSAWDPVILLAGASRAARGEALAIGWSAAGGALSALVPVRGADSTGDGTLPRLTLGHVLPGDASPSGEVVLLPAPPAGPGAPTNLLVYEGAPARMLVLADTLELLPAPALTTFANRLAFGWSRQRLGVITDALPAPHPRAIVRRDVRTRIAALAPFFAQGTMVTPAMHADSLVWIVDLYAASETYPLSRADSLGHAAYSYVQHAATAIVNAHTGRVLLVRDDSLDPLALSWVQRYPELFTPRARTPPDLLAALPPAADLARLQARVLARYGRRGEEPPLGDLPPLPMDSLASPEREGTLALPAGLVAWCTPVLDGNQHVTGLVLATGGAARSTWWLPFERPGARWVMIPQRLKAALDSAPGRDPSPGTRLGAVRAVPVAGGAIFVQSEYSMRADAPVELRWMAAMNGGAALAGRTTAQALGAPGGANDATTLSPARFHAQVAALYAQMRAALQRGDWPAFGRAYDALGALLARPVRAP